VKQGVGVVLSGSVEKRGTGYALAVKASETVSGKEIASARGRASSKDDVMAAATKLVASVRKALGDETSESNQLFAMASLSSTSLDVVRLYSAAQDAASNGKFEEARQHALEAVALDPKFGIGYQVLAVASRNLGNLQDAQKYIDEALRHITGMTERERLTTRGYFYRVTGDYQQCVKEYGDLIARYAADVVGRNQVALCSSQLRDLRRAVDEMKQVVKLLPKRLLFRNNLMLYANYASDFQLAESEARGIDEADVYSLLALAFAQLGQDQPGRAKDTYATLGSRGAIGASISASGLGDLAIYQGRYGDAVRILEQGVTADTAAKSPDRAAAKLAGVAYAQLARGQKRQAVVAAESARASSTAVKIRFLSARVFIEAGETAKARPLIAALAAELQTEPQAYAKILDGKIALGGGDPREAIKLMLEGNKLLDTWIGDFELGRAYLAAGALPQADSQFDRCLKRKGEALALFLDEEPTFGYFPSVYYYQGRVREQMKIEGFAESYRQYIAARGGSTEDALLREIRPRSGRTGRAGR
jgi:tetratricopeptide (TPR) repeat protein